MKKKLLIRVPVFNHVPTASELREEIGPVVDLEVAFRWSLSKWKSKWEDDPRRLTRGDNCGLCIAFQDYGFGIVGCHRACPLYYCVLPGLPYSEFCEERTAENHDAVLLQIEHEAKKRGFKVLYYDAKGKK